jgi:hypothetical protein
MATRTVNRILADIIGAFKTRVPALQAMGGNFSGEPLYLGQQSIAHVESLPTIADYDATTGYANGATEAADLLTDVPIIIDGHKHVPVKLTHLRNIADEKKYISTVGNQSYVLGKAIVDSVLNKVHAGNISTQKAVASASIDYDYLLEICGTMNTNKAATTGRRGIVSTAVMNTLCGDTRIASGDYHGQRVGGSALRSLTNIAGFESIEEYPELPANNAATQDFVRSSGNILTAAAHGFVTGQKVRVTTTAADLPAGLAVDTTYYVIKLSANTFSLATTDANATAGTAITLSDAGTGTHSIVGFENLTGFFFESRAFALKTGVPGHSDDIAAELGVPIVMPGRMAQDPETQLAMMLFMWQVAGRADLHSTVAALWGSCVGRQAGAQYALTDRAGLRLVSA